MSSSRTILGVDPGNARCGWGLVADTNGHLELLECGCLGTPAHTCSGDRLLCVYNGLSSLLSKYHPDEFAVEKLYFNRNVTSAMGVAEARGVSLLAAAQAGVPITEYTPSQIKEALTSSGRANKEEVRTMVMMTLNLAKKPRPDDVSDAIAVALTHIFYSQLSGQ